MSTLKEIPESYKDDGETELGPKIEDAYRRGWDHGQGFAGANVPTLGAEVFSDGLGRVVVDAENIREVHASACYSAEENSRQFSPFEFTAHEFNESEYAEELWEAFDAGIHDAITANLATYTDADYGIGE